MADRNGRSTTTFVALGREDLVVEGAHLHSEGLPRAEVVGGGDRSPDALGLADGPELVECRRARDGRGIGAYSLIYVVGVAIGGDRAHVGEPGTGVVVAEGVTDVVLDERARGPSVNGKIGVACGTEGSAVRDCPEAPY